MTKTRARKPTGRTPVKRYHPTTQYAQDVRDGKIVTGRLVRLACERHLRDLNEGPARGIKFVTAKADHALNFFKFLHLAEGEFAGKPFTLQPWQVFIVGSLFGWVGEDGYRRFRTAYIEAGKGSGKTPLVAAIGLYGLIADGEAGAEIYTAGVTRGQANYVLNDAKNLVDASPDIKSRLDIGVHHLALLPAKSYMHPVSSEARSLDQKRVHMALIDEIHEHPNSLVVDKMRAGTKGRRQALIIEITNSGYDRNSICWQHHEQSRLILEGTVQNDSWFAYVCGLDVGDDWTDPGVWIKANPNLGISVSDRYIREQVAEALEMPAKQNIVKRLNCCIWTEQATMMIPMEDWDAQPERADLETLRGRECWAGVDLSSRSDLTAVVLVFPDSDGGYDVYPYFWLPADNIGELGRQAGVRYDLWVEEGLLELTTGGAVDLRIIVERIKALRDLYELKEIPYDPWNAGYLEAELGDAGAPLAKMVQSMSNLSAPSKEMLTLLKTRKLRHGNNPVLRWMASNTAAEVDVNGNIRIHKGKSMGKIDGISGLVMALGRAMVSDHVGPSVYETPGSLWL